ncbi:MAG: hypothetical protein ACJARP_002623, partial [Vicingaceae bacterium]
NLGKKLADFVCSKSNSPNLICQLEKQNCCL